jgi:kynurenine formamidase
MKFRNSLAAAVMTLAAGLGNAQAEDKWYPSKWGADDQLGSFNMNGPERTLEAAKLIKTGKTYRLGIETSAKTPSYPPRYFHLTVLTPNQGQYQSLGDNKFNFADDIIAGWMGSGSQLDGLGHAAIDDVYYNGKRSAEFIRADGLTMFGLHNIPPVVTRGVLIDLEACKGKMLVEGEVITPQDIKDCATKQQTEIRKGDVVLLNTGWLSLLGKDDARFGKGEPGIGSEGAKYLASLDVMAVGADTWGLEVLPGEKKNILFPVHQELLTKAGIYILENMDTRELAKDKAYEFMFVLGAARMTGSVQMIINPIAIR